MPAEHLVKDEDDFEEDTLFDQAGLLTNKIKRHSDVHNVNNTMRITPMKTFALCLAFFGLGLSISILEPTLLDLQYLAGTSSKHIFYVITARSIGYILGSVLGILLFDRYNRQFLLFLTMIGITVFLGILPWCNNLAAYIFILLVLGMLMQLLYSGGNVLCLDLWGRQSGPFLQAIHFSLSLGLFIAPLLSNTISAGKTVIPLTESSDIITFNHSCIIALPASALYNIHFSIPSSSRRQRRSVENFNNSFALQENITSSPIWNSSIYNTHEENTTSINFVTSNFTLPEPVINKNYSNNSTILTSTTLSKLALNDSNGSNNDTTTTNASVTVNVTSISTRPPHKPKPPATYGKHLKHEDKWERKTIEEKHPSPVVITTSTVVSTTPNATSSTATTSNASITFLTSNVTSTFTIVTPTTIDNLFNVSSSPGTSNTSELVYSSVFLSNASSTEDMIAFQNASLDDGAIELENSSVSDSEIEVFPTNESIANALVENKTDDPIKIINDTTSDVSLTENISVNHDLLLKNLVPTTMASTNTLVPTLSKTIATQTIGTSILLPVTENSEKSNLEVETTESSVQPKTGVNLNLPQKDFFQTVVDMATSSITSTENDNISTSTVSNVSSFKSSTVSSFPKHNSSLNITYIDSSTLKSRIKNVSNDNKGVKNNTIEEKLNESQSTVTVPPISPTIKTIPNCSQNTEHHDNHIASNTSHKKPHTFNNQTEESVLLLTDLMNKINKLGISKVHIVYAVMALIVFLTSLVFLSFLCQNPRELRSKQEEGVKSGLPESKFTSIMVGLAFVLLIFYAVAQLVFSQLYLSLILQQSTHLLSSRGSLLISVFWGVFAFSRATSICCTNGFKPATMLIVDFVCCILSSATLAFFGSHIESLLWCSVAIMAIGLSSIFPYCLLWLEDYIHISNKTACIILLGGSSVDLILSLTFGHEIMISSTTVIYLVLVCCVFALLIFGIMWRLATWHGDKYGCCKAETQYHLASQIDDEEDSMEFSSGNTSLYLLNNGTNFSLPSWDRKNENSYIPLKHKKSKWK